MADFHVGDVGNALFKSLFCVALLKGGGGGVLISGAEARTCPHVTAINHWAGMGKKGEKIG